jgi:hypothetical protein
MAAGRCSAGHLAPAGRLTAATMLSGWSAGRSEASGAVFARRLDASHGPRACMTQAQDSRGRAEFTHSTHTHAPLADHMHLDRNAVVIGG